MRTFVALPLEEHVITAYARWRQLWERSGPRLRWVNPSLLHVTIRFLGELEEQRVNQVKAAVEAAARQLPACRLRIAGRGVFPDGRHPQVFWLGVEPRDWLVEVANRVDQELAQVGWLPRTEPFQAHLTAARAQRDGFVPTDYVQAWLAATAQTQRDSIAPQPEPTRSALPELVADSQATELVVMESRLRPGGPLYIPQGQYPLTGR